MNRSLTAATAAAVFAFANTAMAAGSMDAFVAGDYAAARDLGREEGDAAGLSVACRAGLVIGSYAETGAARVDTLHGAIDDCASAIKAGNAKVDAYVNYAIGLAFEAKRVHSPSLAGETRKLLEASVERFPDSGFARAALGGWHAQVAAQGFMARTVLGASRDEAKKNFDAAMRLDPDNVSVRYEYLRYLAVGGRGDRAEGVRVAAAIARMPTKGAFERLVQEHAARVGQAIGVRGKAGEAALAAAMAATESFAGVEGEGAGVRFAAPLNAFPAAEDTGAAQ